MINYILSTLIYKLHVFITTQKSGDIKPTKKSFLMEKFTTTVRRIYTVSAPSILNIALLLILFLVHYELT